MSELDDFLVVDSDSGDLLIQSPDNPVLNITANLSLACWSQAIREDRSWSEFGGCFSMLFSLFSLDNVLVTGFPLALLMPWEGGDQGVVGDGDAAHAASAIAPNPGRLAYHDETTHTHTYTHNHGSGAVAGVDLAFFIVVFGLLALFLSLCLADSCAEAYTSQRGRKGNYEAVAA